MKCKFPLHVIGVLALALGAASGAQAAPPPACALLTRAQVTDALGAAVGPGRPLLPTICIWRGASGQAVRLNLINQQAFAMAKLGVGMKLQYGLAKTEVKGAGDDAVYVSVYGKDTTLTVKKGQAAFTILVTGFAGAAAKAREMALAVEVCSKL